MVSGGNTTTLGTALCPPPNVGKKTTPLYNDANGHAISGATTEAGLDSLTKPRRSRRSQAEPSSSPVRATIASLPTFPASSICWKPRVIGNSLGQNGSGVDGFKGYNVLTYAIQIPMSSLPAAMAYTDAFFGASNGVGVFASVSRPRLTLRSATGPNTSSGPMIQVNRLGNPLFNEALVALQDKDNYNRNLPVNDVGQWLQRVTLRHPNLPCF